MLRNRSKRFNPIVGLFQIMFFGIRAFIIFVGIFFYDIFVVFYKILKAIIVGFINTSKSIITVSKYWKERGDENNYEKKTSI